MNLEFGVVYNYYPRNGFGIVTNPLNVLKDRKTFFHISNIKKSNFQIFNKIYNYNYSEIICFWYEFEITPKGHQIKRVISQTELKSFIKTNLQSALFKEYYFPKLKNLWLEIHTEEPVWLYEISLNVFDDLEIKNLQKQKEAQLEIQRKENERLKKIKDEEEEIKRLERERLKKIQDEKEEIQRIEHERLKKLKDEEEGLEFELLVAEVSSKGFTLSSQVSSYIVRNKLGNKYKNISGVLTMRNETSEWNFKGGFPPKIYAMLCDRLGLGNNGSHSQVLDFTPFKDL